MTYESLEEAQKYHIQHQTHWIGESLGEYKYQIWDVIARKNVKTVLDYGCGKAHFHKLLFNNPKTPGAPTVQLTPYDPAYFPFAEKPTGKFDLVLCIDVMEHVQEDQINNVLEDIFSFSDNVFLTITCYKATQTLLNGKNAHYTVKKPEWWKEKLKPYDGKYKVVFQTRPERGSGIINKEEWNPSAETLEKLKVGHKTLDEGQKEKAKLLR
jgi:SAM-dependent methyltransferase